MVANPQRNSVRPRRGITKVILRSKYQAAVMFSRRLALRSKPKPLQPQRPKSDFLAMRQIKQSRKGRKLN